MRPSNERWRYTITPSLIVWAQTQNIPRMIQLSDAYTDHQTSINSCNEIPSLNEWDSKNPFVTIVNATKIVAGEFAAVMNRFDRMSCNDYIEH